MSRRVNLGWLCVLAGLAVSLGTPAAPAQQKSYRLPGVDLKQQVIWGATCDGPNGTGLAFGGQDQKADDGQAHTRIKVNGEWKAIHTELRQNNPLQKQHERCRALARELKDVAAQARRLYFSGHPADKENELAHAGLLPALSAISRSYRALMIDDLKELMKSLKGHEKRQAEQADRLLDLSLRSFVDGGELSVSKALGPRTFELFSSAQHRAEQAAEWLDAEPPARALSPIVYDEKTKVYVLFGGDHLDYLTNDTWVFDPAKQKWEQRQPKAAPPPRANHALKAGGEGKVVLSGGYAYTSSTDYVGGQYRDLGDGDWTYDVAADTWTGTGKSSEPEQRVYRTGRLHSDFYLQGPRADAAGFQKQLQDLPANTWVATKPPHLPALNRDWGTAILDHDRDLILRFGGGHSAHGGSDVLHFHLASNRWELPFPVEFPLGQLYSNTSYPDGFNFNMRPWVTGHTYQNYGYDPHLKKMLFTGQPGHCYIYDPDVADWTGRFPKPRGMVYDSCFYTLTLCPTPQGLVCWTKDGRVFLFDAKKQEWVERPLTGAKLPGAVVDNSTLAYDSRRDRLLFVSKSYGDKVGFSGEVHALDLKTWTVAALAPKNAGAATTIPYLCQLRYDSDHDLWLVGGTLPPGDDGLRRTPAYDCASNTWVSLKIGGDDPNGKSGRNVSLGLMYDGKRKRFWAVDTNSRVFVLRLDPKTADLQPLR